MALLCCIKVSTIVRACLHKALANSAVSKMIDLFFKKIHCLLQQQLCFSQEQVSSVRTGQQTPSFPADHTVRYAGNALLEYLDYLEYLEYFNSYSSHTCKYCAWPSPSWHHSVGQHQQRFSNAAEPLTDISLTLFPVGCCQREVSTDYNQRMAASQSQNQLPLAWQKPTAMQQVTL